MKKEKMNPQAETVDQEIETHKKTGKAGRVISIIVDVVLVLAIILAAASTYISYVSSSGNGVPSILGVQILSIQTESMYPVLKPGDLIFSKTVDDPATLEVGDIITYWTVINGERVLNTHTVHGIYDGGGYLIFSTKGENNTSADPLSVHEAEIVGKYFGKIGGLGKAFDYLQTSTGFLIVVVVPVFIFFLFYLVQFFRVLFEYQNVKNRIKYEQERGRTEDLLEAQQRMQQEEKEKERAALEAELREKLKAELLASMGQTLPVKEEPAEEETSEETSKETPEETSEEEESVAADA